MMPPAELTMDGVREYVEGFPVYLAENEDRPVVLAYNEGGFNSTLVDLLDLIEWVKTHRPEWLIAGAKHAK